MISEMADTHRNRSILHSSTAEEEPSIDTDKLSYEIFSILESKFLFKSIEDKNGVVLRSEGEAIRNQRGRICVLAIDGGGGGMRGILSGKALAYLEKALKVKSGDPEARISDYFDVAAGSGVGGIFTAMLFGTKDMLRPIYTADETWRFLAEKGRQIYVKSLNSVEDYAYYLYLFINKIYSSCNGGGGIFRRVFRGGNRRISATAKLEKAMKSAFTDEKTGRSLTLKDTLKPVLIPCYDFCSHAPFVFSRAAALENDSYDFNLSEVCRATAAEPAVFKPVCMSSVDGATPCVAVDGGGAMSNPTAAAITHVLHNKQEFPFVRGVEDILVLSLGPGQLLEGSFEFDKVKNWKAKQWALPTAHISGDTAADLVDHVVAMAFGHSRATNYVRVQANGLSPGCCGVNLDTDPSPNNVKRLVEIADEMLKQKNVESVLFSGKKVSEQSNLEKLEWFAGELVKEHKMRSCRIAPTVAFKQATPHK